MTEIAARVPVDMGDKVVGTAYVVEDEIFMVIKNRDLMAAVNGMLPIGGIRSFMLGVCYTPAVPAEEVADGRSGTSA